MWRVCKISSALAPEGEGEGSPVEGIPEVGNPVEVGMTSRK